MGASQSFAYLNHQCCMVIPGSGYCMGMLDRGYRMVMLGKGYGMVIPGRGYRMVMLGRGYRYSKLIYAGPSQCTNVRQQYIFFYKYIYLFSKAFTALYVFMYQKFNDFVFFCVLMVSLKILTLLSQPDSKKHRLGEQQQHQMLYLHDHKGITILQKLLV